MATKCIKCIKPSEAKTKTTQNTKGVSSKITSLKKQIEQKSGKLTSLK